ncbi:MAG: glycosyltransferase [Endomicrobiales bacterium]
MNNKPLVSVVIPVKNGQDTIEKCIRSLFALNYPRFEVIVIDDGSTDRTAAIVKSLSSGDAARRLRLLEGDSAGPSRARNRGIAEAKGDFVAFTDDDCLVDREWLNELLKGFRGDTAAVGGTQKSPEDESAFGKAVHDFMMTVGFLTDYMKDPSGAGIREVDHNPTCNAMYRREVFAKTGGFMEDLWPGEDVELDYRVTRAGYRIVFAPKAVVYHYRPENLRQFRRMMFNYGRVQAYLVKKYGVFRKIQLVPAVFYPAAVVLAAGMVFWPSVFFAALSSLLFSWVLYFTMKGLRAKDAFRYTWWAAVTLWEWNLGFGRGLVERGKRK